MKILKVKSILLSLMTMMAVAVFMTSCSKDESKIENESLQDSSSIFKTLKSDSEFVDFVNLQRYIFLEYVEDYKEFTNNTKVNDTEISNNSTLISYFSNQFMGRVNKYNKLGKIIFNRYPDIDYSDVSFLQKLDELEFYQNSHHSDNTEVALRTPCAMELWDCKNDCHHSYNQCTFQLQGAWYTQLAVVDASPSGGVLISYETLDVPSPNSGSTFNLNECDQQFQLCLDRCEGENLNGGADCLTDCHCPDGFTCQSGACCDENGNCT